MANFTASVTSGCAPLSVNFTDQSTGNPTTWSWEFSNGTLSSDQNPGVTFTDPGTYSVKLVVRNANGIDQIERLNYITVLPAPIADYTANLTLGCVPVTVNFTSLASTPSGTIVSWEWDFGDGGTSTLQNPSHTYTSVGFYAVSLTVTSSNGCKSTALRGNYIRVVDGINTDFAYSMISSCQPPFTINFQNYSSGPGNITYTWNFGNSLTSNLANPSTVYNAPGTYTIRLDAQSDLGCSGFIEKTITLTSTATDFTAPTNVCLAEPVTFQNSSSAPPVLSFWNFGDGTVSAQINPVKTYLTPGTYNVTLVNQYANCTDSITKTITVTDRPMVNFTVDDSVACQAPFNVQFTDLTPGATSWQWNFGDGNTSTLQNPAHTYTAVGAYTVTLTATTAEGCTNTFVKPAYINIQPISLSFNAPEGGCIPFTYYPLASIQSVEPIVSYLWNLGEPGAIFNVAIPPPYTYTSAGNFDVSLTVTTASGCTQTLSIPRAISTGVRPIVSFTSAPQNACASDTINFANTSVTTPGATVGYIWDFGDGSTSNLQNPDHVFQDTGAIVVTLIVYNNGCVDSVKQTQLVRPPVAFFNYSFDCNTQQVTFRDSSLVNPGLTPLTYLWEMGDPANTQFTTQNPPPFTYPGPGTYPVTLTVTNGPCSYERTRDIVIANETANFSISKNPVCKNESFTLTAINTTLANVRSYSWTVGTITGAGSPFTLSIPDAGTYSVTLTVTDLNGCVTTRTINNYITVSGPVAGFTPATPGACLNRAVTFNDLSTPAGTITNWNFDFGDGVQQNFTSPPFTHVYAQTGGYVVSMTVTDGTGCTDRYVLPVELLVTKADAGFRTDSFYCPASPLQFFDSSSGAGLTYRWNFGDGNTSALANPQNSFPAGDNDYTVQLIIRDISGCEDTVSKVVKIRSPKPAFDILDSITICPPLRTVFTFQGSDYQSFFWDFGDGNTSTLANPSYFYNNYGIFTPTLTLIGPGGCTATASGNVTVYNPFTDAAINFSPTTACNSLDVNFNLTVPPGFKFYFNFGDGTIDSSGATSFIHSYPRPSFNQTSLTIVDTISQCQVTIYGDPRIDVLGAIPLFDMDRDEFCDSGWVVFTNYTTKNDPIVSTVWDFGDGLTSNAQEPTHFFTQPGTYHVQLNVTTQAGCSSSYSDSVLVYRTPAPSIVSRDTLCINIPEPINGLLAVPDTVTNWQWSFGNGQSSSSQNNTITYTTTGDFTLQLTTTNQIGCSASATKQVHVVPPPTATPVQNPITIMVGAGADLLMDYTGNIASYTWTPNTQLSCINCPTPFADPKKTTTYNVELEDVYGCRNTSEITVVVQCMKQNVFIPNTFSPNGDGQNDIFYPRGTGIFRMKSLIVFNRWGEIVFERKDFAANDQSAGWNGMYKGQKASADVYVYLAEILCENSSVAQVKGNVMLIR